MKPNVMDAIRSLDKDAEVRVGGFGTDDITWLGDTTAIPTGEIEAELERLQAEYDANQYQRDRATDYPTWQEQMDLIYHKGVAGLKAELKKTKDKFPKE